jgi:hypothetical protein
MLTEEMNGFGSRERLPHHESVESADLRSRETITP